MDIKRLNEIDARMVELRSALQSNDKIDLTAIEQEINDLNNEREEIRKRQEVAEKINTNEVESKVIEKIEERDCVMKNNNIDSMEYRNAFMQFCQTGVMTEEFRDVAMTAANTAVIPTTVLNEIVEKLESYGNILPLVSRVAYPAGVSIATANMGIEATWTAEGSVADKQGAATAAVVFGGYKLQTRVAVSLELSVKSLAAFESAIANNVSKAMVKALELAIVSGDGNGKPTGITTVAVPADRKVTANALAFKVLTDLEAAVPAAYDSTAVYVMAKKTFMEFEAMEDKSGQPIARTNYGLSGKPERVLLGRTVVLTDTLPAFSTAKAGDVVAFAYDMSGYVLNTNYDVGVRKFFDEDTDEWISKATMIVDGKPVDTESLVLLAKGAKG